MPTRKKPLTIRQILEWADAHHRRTGRWPSQWSGKIKGATGETWSGVNVALRKGGRGFAGGSSLSRLLAQRRGKAPGGPRRARLTIKQILAWADEYHRRTGRWPSMSSGRIPGSNGETWINIHRALAKGARGLASGLTLPRLLLRHGRGTAGRAYAGRLTIKQILAWADAHHRRTGTWPRIKSGKTKEAPDENWAAINRALGNGWRGLKPGLSLAKLLWRYRSVRTPIYRPNLTIDQILGWADAHYQRTGTWPNHKSGEIPLSRGESWSIVEQALRKGQCGLPAVKTLARLLLQRRGARAKGIVPPLTKKQILTWCDKHFRRTGTWPGSNSGPVLDAPGETWLGVDIALRQGGRGLDGDESLATLLDQERGISPNARRPILTVSGILSWADAFHGRTGRWPANNSGPIPEAPGETWLYIAAALKSGGRGLPTKGLTLRDLLAQHRGVPLRRPYKARLTAEQILAWADAHHSRTGDWPRASSGPVYGERGQTWAAIDAALRAGCRGLEGGQSLRGLLAKGDHVSGSP
jgi:hypothetical protein